MQIVITMFSFVIPVLITYFWITKLVYRKESKNEHGYLYTFFIEDDFERLFGVSQIEYDCSLQNYLKKRFRFSLLITFAIVTINLIILHNINYKAIVFSLAVVILAYKSFYWNLHLTSSLIMIDANKEFPYYIKTLSLLMGVKSNVHNALYYSLDYAPKVFERKLQVLCDEIHQSPNSVEPFNKFIDSYKGVDELSAIFRILYRLSSSSTNNSKLLNSLYNRSQTLVKKTRQRKNKNFNATISLLGFIPLFILMGAMLLLMQYMI